MADLSEKYPETLFLKVDAEICTVRPQFVDYSFFFLSAVGMNFCDRIYFCFQIRTIYPKMYEQTE